MKKKKSQICFFFLGVTKARQRLRSLYGAIPSHGCSTCFFLYIYSDNRCGSSGVQTGHPLLRVDGADKSLHLATLRLVGEMFKLSSEMKPPW